MKRWDKQSRNQADLRGLYGSGLIVTCRIEHMELATCDDKKPLVTPGGTGDRVGPPGHSTSESEPLAVGASILVDPQTYLRGSKVTEWDAAVLGQPSGLPQSPRDTSPGQRMQLEGHDLIGLWSG